MLQKFFKDMKVGDIVLIHAGNKPIALVEIKSGYYFSSDKLKLDECQEGAIWFRHRRNVEILKWWDPDTLDKFPDIRQTLKLLKSEEKESFQFILKHWKEAVMKKDFVNVINLLRNFYQVILYGPPGSGKTHLTKEVALEIIMDTLSCKWIIDRVNASFWKEFISQIDGKVLKTKQGSKFKVEKDSNSQLNIIVRTKQGEEKKVEPLTINMNEVLDFLKRCDCNVKDAKVKQGESYIWGVAKRLIDYFMNKFYFIKIIQFHPSYTYEDFVRGIEVKTINGQPVYETKNKIFAQMCEIAKANPDKKFVLIIDEINRTNLPAVLGELIYALEYRGESVETPYEINGDRTLIVPENLYIIGTMNTADRSVGHIDYAIRRRFIFYPVRANKYMIENEKARELYEKVIESIFKEDNMSPEFRDKVEDVKIGHTYFLGDTEKVAYKFVYQVIPLLIEYIRDGILKNEEVVGKAFKDYFGSEGENWKELGIETVKQKLE